MSTLVKLFVLGAISSPSGALSSSSQSTPKQKWKPKISSLEERRKLRKKVHDTELIGTKGFHHVEFYCGDAKSTAFRFSLGLGMPITCTTGQSTGNDQCCSYGLQSDNVRMIFTAPYSKAVASGEFYKKEEEKGKDTNPDFEAPNPLPSFTVEHSHAFFQKHGIAARAIGLEVNSASDAFEKAVKNGATPVLQPTHIPASSGILKKLPDCKGCTIAEVKLYGDVVLRFVSNEGETDDTSDTPVPFLPHFTFYESKSYETYGIRRIDHAVGNVHDLFDAHKHIASITGFHDFAEFTPEDVGTVDSGLNSVVLSSNTGNVLLPLNEPTEGKRKSQIQTYLEQNEGPGLQHLALKTDDIFYTIEKMKHAESFFGGFELMNRPSDGYYEELPTRLGDKLTIEQYEKIQELGILADADDEGILLQVFTKPVGDRPTFFFEIIQRIGCKYTPEGSTEIAERAGCGGFGQGNFKELFKSIEDHEKTLKI